MPIKPEHLDKLLAGYEKPEDLVGSCVDAPVDARDLLTAPAMIGCGHVSGLEVRLCHMPRAGMEIRRPGADQKSER